MKRNKTISIILILVLILTTAMLSYGEPNDKGANGKEKKTEAALNKEIRDSFKESKAEIEILKDEAEAVKDQIEAEYQAALDSGDTELAEQLFLQLEEVHLQFREIKEQFKNQIQERKNFIRSNYTEDELAAINVASENILAEDPDASILGFDSIFSETAEFKFDTPPVIKAGRTVIPVRAITRGFGADLDWDPDTQQVTITKDGIIINLTIDSNIALVNGEEVQLDSKSELMNNRTYVPLRFILETFGLNVEWDDDTDTIDINDPDDEETDENRTGSAIETSDE